jgi:hypothetical protein
MKRLFFLTWLIACSVCGFAGDVKYPVTDIADALKKDVNAVVREDRSVYRIISKSKARLSVYYAITILNDKARSHAHLIVGYDKLTKISDFNAAAYDANGKQIKKLKNSEIYDQSAYDGVSMFSDNRMKAVDMTQVSYPYTVVFEYEKEYNFILGIDGASVLPGEKISLEKFSFQLVYPPSLAPRYKAINMPSDPVKGTSDGLESLTWSLENVLPVTEEPYSPEDAFFPRVVAAPTTFEFDGYSGNMSSWNDFGKWIQLLNKGRNVLPEHTREMVQRLTAGVKTPEEKVKILYEYLQSKTRYVAIMLGIGGFQPFDATVVDQTGYGDCKALSNYMVSMLDVAGIKSHYALVYGGDDYSPIDVNFPRPGEFNHVIVAVPMNKDTIWLECTNQTIPFGFQGSFTGNRKALLITDQGGTMVNTTRYNAEQNLQTRTADVFLDMTGDGKAKVKTRYSGVQYENDGLHFIVNYQYNEQKKWVQSTTKIPTFDLNSFSMVNQKSRIPTAVVNLDLTIRKYAPVSGKRLFVTPNLMNRSTYVPEKVENRKSKVVTRIDYVDSDTIRFHLPEGIHPEYIPPAVKLSNRFGEYEATYQLQEDGLFTYIRRVKMRKGEFPPDSYNELIDFFKAMAKADNTKVVFLSKT